MTLKKVVMALVCAASLAAAATVFADPTPKYWVDHKGNWICVDGDSVSAHVGHGDLTYYEVCAE
jgi:hypothetical protein